MSLSRQSSYPLAPANPRLPALLRLRPYIAPYRWQFIGSFVLAPVQVGLSILTPILLGAAIDGPIRQRNFGGVIGYALALLGVGAGAALASFLRRWIMTRATSHLEATIRLELFDQLQRLPMSFHKKWQSGQLLSRAMSDLGVLRRFLAFGLVLIFMSAFHIVVVVTIMMATLWQVGLAVLALALPIVVTVYLLLKRLDPVIRRVQDQTGDIASAAEESLHGVRVVRSFGRGKYVYQRFDQRAQALARSGVERMNLSAVLWTLLEVFPSVLLVMVLYGVASGVSRGLLTLGDSVTFITLLLSLSWPIGGLGFLLSFAKEADTAAKRVCEIFDAPLGIVSGTQQIEQPRGKLELREVHYRFDDADEDTLDGLNLVVEPGETVALVGGTGSGKSTIIALLSRLIDPTAGQVLIDDVDIRDVSLPQLRSLVATAFEDPILFSMSARENLTLGRPEASDSDTAEAIRVAHAEFVYDLPWGLDTRLGEQGLSLSGGQRQRLALARALLVRPSILVLDDTLSALDIHTEAEVEQALKSTLVGVTGIVVAHRASTVLLADRVAMLSQGKITHIGTHQELLANVAEYRELLSADYAIEPVLEEER